MKPTAAQGADWPRRLKEEILATNMLPSPALQGPVVHGEKTYRGRRQQSPRAERKAVYVHAGLSRGSDETRYEPADSGGDDGIEGEDALTQCEWRHLSLLQEAESEPTSVGCWGQRVPGHT